MKLLYELQEVVQEVKSYPKDGSYTSSLFTIGEDEILKKIGEESVEVILAAKSQGSERLVAESADLLYHLIVLLVEKGLTLQDVEQELKRRRN
ncbi:MAG TPA: phosphoribosyl-ATP diphosphatase [Chloroflexi bacterium]|nr:phosphoribosyl-ATP diphosphatase [Chloroflexota bacterium]HCU97868.1 phosphoribosyl-ATP diphosphatase [Chloroflexota bacterium]|tara:strand:- start:2123 stop:2401 length:279 start_codon:yes stop_codon:yes gene_type:complete